MIILNTTFIVEDARLKLESIEGLNSVNINVVEFYAWARHTYLPAMDLAGIFTDKVMARVTTRVEPGATSVAIQARTASIEQGQRWHDDTAAILRDDLVARFNGQALFFTTYMEIVD